MSEKLYLLGHPIAHSKSPDMYNAVYASLKLPWHYALKDCATEEEAQAFLDARTFLSINITTPYKPLALKAATARAASARLAGGANLLVKKGSALLAFNTDGQGCVANLERCGFDFHEKSVCVCGTGATALAIVQAAAVAGAKEVILLSRNKRRSEAALKHYLKEYGILANATIDLPAAKEHHRSFRTAFVETTFKFGSYTSSTQALAAADLIVNATPLGMKAGDKAPFNTDLLHEDQWVFDAVYGHGETALVAAAKAAGCTTYDGAGMLVAQAAVTVQTFCDINEIELTYTEEELFDYMAKAARFNL